MPSAIVLHLANHRTLSRRAIDAMSIIEPTEVLEMSTVAQLLETVEHTPGCAGVLPVEDTYAGEDTAILDRLIFHTSQVRVCEEVVVSETLGAFRVPGDIDEPRFAVAEPRAIEHSRAFIQQNGLSVRFVDSAQAACDYVGARGDAQFVALASADVAAESGLVPVASSVGDLPAARTRFFVVSREVAPPSGADKTTLVITQPKDQSGNLQRFLGAFTSNDVNLVSLHSRPLQSPAEFCFLVTAEAHIQDANLQAAIAELWDVGAQLRVLGSYCNRTGDTVITPFDEPPSSVGRQSSDAARDDVLRPPVTG